MCSAMLQLELPYTIIIMAASAMKRSIPVHLHRTSILDIYLLKSMDVGGCVAASRVLALSVHAYRCDTRGVGMLNLQLVAE